MTRANAALDLSRRYPVGPELLPGVGAHFRVWAPEHDEVFVVERKTRDTSSKLRHGLSKEPQGPHGPSQIVDGKGYVWRTRAHGCGLSVILDVVYNHLGPDGNYLKTFSADYFTDRYKERVGRTLQLRRAQ